MATGDEASRATSITATSTTDDEAGDDEDPVDEDRGASSRDGATGGGAGGGGATGDQEAGDDVTSSRDQPQRTSSQSDMSSPTLAGIDDVVEIDERILGVRFWNGAEPCARARVSLSEAADEVVLGLETGLHPNVAAMTCITGEFYYEIPMSLVEPLGDRAITFATEAEDPLAEDPEDPVDEPSDEAAVIGEYIGLSQAEGETLAAEQGRAFRVEREDGERLALTRDHRPDRINVQIDSGVITAGRMG